MKSMQLRGVVVALVALALGACTTATPTQTAALTSTGQTALVDVVACAGDAAAVNGKTLMVAKSVASDANCIAALNALVAAGAAAGAVVAVPAPAAVATP